MKKHLLILSFTFAFFSSIAQTAIPNGDFESWSTATYEYPEFFISNSNPEAFFNCNTPFNVIKSTDAYSGSYALQMTTNSGTSDTCFGYVVNTSTNTGGPGSWVGGIPMTENPTGIMGYYKYNQASADSAIIIIQARQGGTTIGTYFYFLSGLHTTYNAFNFTFSPALAVTPDSIIVAIASSDPNYSGTPGSTLLIDDFSFTGVTAQPSQLNGGFESWLSVSLDMPNSWSSNRDGVYKTTDKYAGNFAIELQTYLGENNGTPRAQSGYSSNGYYDNACNCMRGGFPFSNQVDTLQFYYKYVPADPTDSAQVAVAFKNSGVNVGWASMYLHSSPSYQLAEIPFNLGSMPDTAIVMLQSSNWNDTTINFVGASLKVDDIQFKSQPIITGIGNGLNLSNEVSVFPNPFNSNATILIGQNINTVGMEITLYDLSGRVVKKIKTSDHKIIIDRNGLNNGIYLYDIINETGKIKSGKVVVVE